MAGLFLSFEGIDGAGKTTQLYRVADRLQRAGLLVLTTREPGGTALGEELRRLILPRAESANHPLAELFLLSAARAQLVATVIRPALERGVIVLADRYADATLAYQGYGRGLDLEMLWTVNRVAMQGVTPLRTLLLDVPLEESGRRLGVRGGGSFFDAAADDFRERVRQGYLELAKAEPGRWRVIDGYGTPEEVAARVDAALADVLRVLVV